MKRCPKCNQTFSETWLSFCTQDGTTLIDDSVSQSEPPPTIMSSAPPPVSNPNPQPGWNTPSGGFGSNQFPAAQPVQSAWQPPPAPAYKLGPAQGIAVTSMCFGIFTMTFGWCCYLGVLTGLVAIPLGIYSLIQIKNNPDRFGGKPFAIVGIITAALYYVGLVFFVLLWGAATFMKGVN